MKRFKSGLLVAATVLLIIVASGYLKRPYPLIFGLTSVAFIFWTAVLATRERSKRIALSIGSVLLILCLTELILSQLQERRHGSYSYRFDPPRSRFKGGWDPHWRVHDLIGYIPVSNSIANVQKRRGGDLVYDVRYGLNEHGWRKIPASNDTATDSILFFGGSFIFGEGSNDDQTIPHHVARLLQGRYSVHSFAFGGYGAHEMLAILENGLESEWMREGQIPRIAYYVAIPEHVQRVAGFTSWNRFGPRYVVDGQSVKRVGSFSDQSIFPRSAHRYLMPSALMRQLYYDRFAMQPVTDQHRILWAKVIEKAKNLFETRYPQSEFHLALWGHPNTLWPKVDLPPARIHYIWKSFPRRMWAGKVENSRYFIEGDGHPTELTNKLVASFLIRRLSSKARAEAISSGISRPLTE